MLIQNRRGQYKYSTISSSMKLRYFTPPPPHIDHKQFLRASDSGLEDGKYQHFLPMNTANIQFTDMQTRKQKRKIFLPSESPISSFRENQLIDHMERAKIFPQQPRKDADDSEHYQRRSRSRVSPDPKENLTSRLKRNSKLSTSANVPLSNASGFSVVSGYGADGKHSPFQIEEEGKLKSPKPRIGTRRRPGILKQSFNSESQSEPVRKGASIIGMRTTPMVYDPVSNQYILSTGEECEEDSKEQPKSFDGRRPLAFEERGVKSRIRQKPWNNFNTQALM